MKRRLMILFSAVLILLCTSCASSCSCLVNEYETHEGGIYITMPESLKVHMIYPDDIPSLFFEMDSVNVTKNSSPSTRIFVQNDPFAISEAWAKHLERYDDDEYIILNSVHQEYDKDGKVKFGKGTLTLDEFDENGNVQKHSVEQRIVAWDKDGTRYSYQYRTFVSEGKRYYSYCYAENLTIVMEQPLMVIQQETGNNKLLLVPLPFDTKYEVGINLTAEALITKNTYCYEVNPQYYQYKFPETLTGLTYEQKVEQVRNWYMEYCKGRDEYYTDEKADFIIEYAGARFKVDFIENKNETEKSYFSLEYLGSSYSKQ